MQQAKICSYLQSPWPGQYGNMMSCLNIFTISLSCQKQLEQGTYEICDCMYWSILIAPAYASENTVYNYNMNGGWNNIL